MASRQRKAARKHTFKTIARIKQGEVDQWLFYNEFNRSNYTLRLFLARSSPPLYGVTQTIKPRDSGKVQTHTDLFNFITDARMFMIKRHIKPAVSFDDKLQEFLKS